MFRFAQKVCQIRTVAECEIHSPILIRLITNLKAKETQIVGYATYDMRHLLWYAGWNYAGEQKPKAIGYATLVVANGTLI